VDGPPPPGIDERELARTLSDSWGLELAGLRYEPKGFGSYHWIGATPGGGRWFVKLDHLEDKPYLGGDPSSVLDGLEAAYGAARLLRESGLGSVVAPVPARDGRILVPLGSRWALTVFPFVAGETGEWGVPGPVARRTRLARTLAGLHGTAVPSGAGLRRPGWDLPGRAELEAALDGPAAAWAGGPFSEQARGAVVARAALIREWLDSYETLASTVAAAGLDPVVTHGEPHPGNVLSAGGEVRLIDWDTAALAPVERDMWMFAADRDALAAYERASGRAVDNTAMDYYRLRWALSDLALFVAAFRREHGRNRVTEKTWTGLLAILDGTEPAPYGTI
jgi:spectinomycin phosphotransferase